MQFNYVYKKDGLANQRLNVAMPYEAFTAVSTGIDPGRDNVLGTGDDRPLTVYAVPRTYPGFGQIAEQIVQAGDDEARNDYTAYGITLNKQQSNGWSFLTSFNADYRDLKNFGPRDPNEALYGPASNTATNGGATTTNPYQSLRARVELLVPHERHLSAAVGHHVRLGLHARRAATGTAATCRCATP